MATASIQSRQNSQELRRIVDWLFALLTSSRGGPRVFEQGPEDLFIVLHTRNNINIFSIYDRTDTVHKASEDQGLGIGRPMKQYVIGTLWQEGEQGLFEFAAHLVTIPPDKTSSEYAGKIARRLNRKFTKAGYPTFRADVETLMFKKMARIFLEKKDQTAAILIRKKVNAA